MKVKQNMAAPLTSGDMLTENIGISDDPEDQMMILNVLTNTLYTDKLAAVLREYGCNGADANVEAGKGDQPIEVRLPNKLDPTLAIRDYGFGMTQDQVIKVFCRLGKSTKRGSNAFTGMLGIGSKAGFAYGDQFMVTSFSGGTRTIYNAFRDKGIPKLAKMHSEATDEPDGIEVKVPVRAEDMAEFTSKAERVYRYFRVRPTIIGAKIGWQDRSQEFSGTGWRFLGRGQQSVAIMGNVGYALDASALGVGAAKPRFSWQTPDTSTPESALLNLGVELDFNIGDLEVAANREGLQYDDETKKALLTKLKIVVGEIGKIMSSKISGFPSMWEAKKQYHTLFEGLSSVNHYELNRVIGTSITWGGKTVDSAKINLESIPSDPDVSITRFGRRSLTYSGSIRLRMDLHPRSIDAADNITLVINDLPSKKNAPARMRGHFAANPDISYIVVFAFQTVKAQADYWKAHDLDGAPTINLSTIAPQVITNLGGYAASAHKSKHSAKVFVLDEKGNHTGRANSLWWNTESVDLKKDGGVYVQINCFLVYSSKEWIHPNAFTYVVKKLRDAGMISGPVYGFKTDRIPKLGPNWIPFKDSLKTKMDALVTKDGFAQEIADFLAVSAYEALLPDSCVKMFPSGSSVRNLLDEQVRMRKPRQKKLLELVESGDADGWLDKPTVPAASVNLGALEMIVYSDYPMIKLAARRMGYGKLEALDPIVIKQIADYVKLTDK